jgi:hypothetical protein
VQGLCGAEALVRREKDKLRLCPLCQCADARMKDMTEKANRARAIGMVIGIIVLVIALLWKRLLR